MKNSLCIIIFLLVSLQGLYIHSIGFSPFVLSGVFLSLFLFFLNTNKTNLKNNFLILSSIFLLLLFGMFGSFYFTNLDLKRIFSLCLLFVFLISLTQLYKLQNVRVLQFVLVVHVIFFYLQFFLYFLFSIDFDPIESITGRSQKGWGGSFYLPFIDKFRRFGGLFNEPGTYSFFISIITSFILIQTNKLSLIICLAIFSVLLSFSTFGFIFVSFIIIYIFIISSSFHRFLFSILTIPVIYPVLIYLFDRFFVRSNEGAHTGLEFRFSLINLIIKVVENDLFFLFFGLGIYGIDANNILGYDEPINDSSFLVSFFISFGIIGLIFLFSFFIYYIKRYPPVFLPIVILCLSKASFLWPFTIVIFFLIAQDLNRHHEKKHTHYS